MPCSLVAHTRALALASSLLSITGCDGATETKSTPGTKANDTKSTPETKSTADTKSTPETKSAPDAAAKGYAAPATPCGIADLSLLGPDVGTANEGTVETEGIDTKLTGCTYDLSGETINTFKLLVNVGADAETRFALSEQVWSQGIPGFVSEPVTGLGAKAIYAVRLTAENQRIESTLAMIDGELYLEARFMGGGTKAWDGADMRERLTKVARAAMTKLAKP